VAATHAIGSEATDLSATREPARLLGGSAGHVDVCPCRPSWWTEGHPGAPWNGGSKSPSVPGVPSVLPVRPWIGTQDRTSLPSMRFCAERGVLDGNFPGVLDHHDRLTCNVTRAGPPSRRPERAASPNPAASITASISAARSSIERTLGAGSERPTPTLSNSRTRENEASRAHHALGSGAVHVRSQSGVVRFGHGLTSRQTFSVRLVEIGAIPLRLRRRTGVA